VQHLSKYKKKKVLIKISREFFIRGVTPLAFLGLLHTDYQ
jgi:hypothetical protein